MNQSYDGVAKALHWAIMILLLPMLYYGFLADDLPKEDKLGFFQIHSGVGLILLVLMVTRLVWRRSHPVPPLPVTTPRWQQIAAKATHHGLYTLVILQPLLGLLITTTSKFNLHAFGILGLQIAPNETLHNVGETLHSINAFIITALIVLHILAALYHHFIIRDNVLRRMLPFVKA